MGIAANDVEILGQFKKYMAVTNFLVTPFVGFLKEGFSVSPNPKEVERILEVPCQFFRQTQPKEEIHHRLGKAVTLYFYEYKRDVIWGLTAAMIKDFVELVEP